MTDLTVYIPAYNAMPYLTEAVESAFAQTFSDFRLLIINDGSTDDSAEYLDSLDDERVTVVHQENVGIAETARRALALCETRFLARLDADDVALPERFATQRDLLVSRPEVGFVCTQVVPLGSQSEGSNLHLPVEHEDIYRALLDGRHAMAYSTSMMQTELVKQMGGIWEYDLYEEFDLMLRVGEIAQLANIPEVLQKYRIHEESANGSAMERLKFASDFARELARRRQTGLPAILPEEFAAEQSCRPWIKRKQESLDLYARRQYRQAQGEMFGSRPLAGRMRLMLAAACSPKLTYERVKRFVKDE